MWIIHLLILFGFTSTVVSQTKPTLVLDVTERLWPILENATSVKFFIETLAQQNFHKGQKLSLLYSLDCYSLADCVKSFSEGEIIMTAIKNHTDLDLILSITLEDWYEDITHLNEFNWISTSGARLLINLHKSTQCDEFWEFIKLLDDLLPKMSPLIPGMGYDENLIECDLTGISKFPSLTPFVVVHLSLGETAGVTESYGLFRRRLSNIHSSQTAFLRKFLRHFLNSKIPITLYSINEEMLGDVCHQSLLARYVENWSDVVSQDQMGFVQISHNQPPENPISHGFSALAKGYLENIGNLQTTLDVVSRYFESVLLDFKDWKNGKNELQNDIFKHQLNTSSNNTLELLLLFRDTREVQTAELESEDWMAEDQFPNVFFSTLIFHIEQNSTGEFKPYEEVLQRMSSKFIIGCMVLMDKVTNRNYSAATDVVETCNKINGTMYILHQSIELPKKDVTSESYYFFYENVLRKEMNEFKAFKELILQRKPSARVVLYVYLWSEYCSGYESVSNFCDDRVLYYNECNEAIINWAKCNNIEIYLKPAISTITASNFGDWFEYLRPVSGKYYSTHKLAELHPYPVLRNYPKDINNWTVDPCINWETARPVISANYFHNQYVGAVFYTDQIRNNEQLTTNEYKIMLQFVINRFGIIEIVFQDSIRDFILACNWVETKSNLIVDDKKILLNYRMPQTVANSQETFLPLFDELKESKLRTVQGIHFDLSTNSSSCSDDPLHLMINFLAKNKMKSIKFGVLIDYNCCMNYVEAVFSNGGSSQSILMLLKQIEYLVCQEKHDILHLIEEDAETVIGNVLDSHLYLKKAFQEITPHLELYFRVSLFDLSPPISGFSDDYMKMVSHFMQSASAYDISYIIIQAFDEEIVKNGWWKIENFSYLSDPLTFVEKEAESSNYNIWRPDALKEEYNSEEVNSNQYALSASIVGVAFILCVAISTFFYLRYKKIRQFLSDEEVKEFLNGRAGGSESLSMEGSGADAEYMKFNTEYKLHISDLHFDIQTILGKGNFGTVYKGTVKETPAAIKTPNKNCSKTCFKSVLSEVKVLCYIGEHSNIVSFLGAYTNEIQRGVLYIATEFCANGSLETFLRKRNNVVSSQDEHASLTVPEREFALFVEDLCRFSIDIACGMEHLQRRHVVHGDLSIRNVLLDETFTCKIADFGLSRKLYDYQKYVKTSQEPLPWKWMAYESLAKMEFTSKSDVWSYGVTVWEIFSLGKIPYCTLNWTLEFADELKNGLRLGKPEYASQEIYEMLLDCWNLDPAQRPTFSELIGFFKEMNKTEYVVLDET